MVQMLNPGTAKTLDYAVHVFCLICTWKDDLLALILFEMYF